MIHHMGWIFRKVLFPQLTWKVPTNEKKLYLTFDDGPVPGVTEWVVDLLAEHQAKATFFCVGDNVRKHPEVFRKVIAAGHTVANHTFNHLDGWKNEYETYLENIQRCDQVMAENHSSGEKPLLYRPPYGKLTLKQIKAIRRNHQIIMWEVLSGDFSPALSPQKCLQKTIQYAGKGSIVVFHDSYKAERNLKIALPGVLAHFGKKGYSFEAL